MWSLSWMPQAIGSTWTPALFQGTLGSQVVLGSDAFYSYAYNEDNEPSSIFLDTLFIPVYAAGISILWSATRLVVSQIRSRVSSAKPRDGADLQGEESLSESTHVQQHGGIVIFLYRVARLVACLALFGLSIFSLVHSVAWHDETHHLMHSALLHLALCAVYAYVSLLAILSIACKPTVARSAIRHLCSILLVVFAVFFYRDMWPLCTTHLRPVDDGEGVALWIHLGVLTFAAAIVPLMIPRQYIPVDPKNPASEPNPEQTASIFSLMIYTFLDHTIFTAYKMPHLPLDKLPPLADYDSTKHLVEKSFRYLDPFMQPKKQHLFFGFMKLFRVDYYILALMLILRVITTFASPIGINRLLAYLEKGGEDMTVRPFVWIIWLLVGPALGSVAVQWYIFIATRVMVRAQAIITQLVFDHALRIRVKAEVTDYAPASSKTSTAATTPDTASLAESTPDRQGSPVSSAGDSENETAGSEHSTVAASKAKAREQGLSSDISASSSSTKVPEKSADGSSQSGNLVGKMTNLVTTDLTNIVEGRDFLFTVLYIPFQMCLCAWFLYVILGWSAWVGMGATLLLFPFPGFIASRIQKVQVEKMKHTDARVQTVTETMNVIRMIKLFGWEPRMDEQLAEKREEELRFLRKLKFLELANGCTNFMIPCVTMVATYATFTMIAKEQLTASIVFSSMVVFDILRENLHTIFGMIPMLIQAKVSLDRANDFLYETELLDGFTEKANPDFSPSMFIRPDIDPEIIGFREASFTWSSSNDGTVTPGPSRRNFVLRIEDELTFEREHINLVVGPTGSGKTSLLMALLGEMHYIPMGPNSFYNLPRHRGIAYATQESWVLNETIRDNILFGAPYDEERYNKVIYQCGLKRDMTLFEAGDKTEVGEKGLTLSGGQKARITLARAVYSFAQLLLLDDVLAALDVHTAKWIVDKCFKGDLLRGRTVLLVTHNIALAGPIADFVVSLGPDGRILSQGSLSRALAKNKKLAVEMMEETDELKKHETEIDYEVPDAFPSKSDGKLIVAEEIAEGHVGWSALKLYFANMGGKHSLWFWTLFLGGMIITPMIESFQTWYLGYWAHQYDVDPEDVSPSYFLGVYIFQLVLANVFYLTGAAVYIFGCLRASRSIHRTLTTSVLSTTLRWLDITPTSRVITRCTQDIAAVDGPIAQYFGFIIELSSFLVVRFVAVIIITPIFGVPGLLIAALGVWLGQIYMKAQLAVKREMSNARAPVLGHFGAAMAGLTSIRAYGAQEAFRGQSFLRIDRYSRAARTFYNLNRWICVRIETLGGIYQAALATYLVYFGSVNASNVGFSLAMAVGFSSTILWWIRLINDFEIAGNSLERIQQYIDIEQEPKPTKSGVPPAYWPASGNLNVEALSARYSLTGPKVLHDISFQVNSGERVGVVGRTGSGKSSLTLSLLRCIFTEGKVYYDGLATDTLNLDALRSNITIIPQVPELLSGTLRQNLDPFSEHDDATLNDALRAAGLFSLQSEDDEGRITLDSPISSGGGNLSVGQRQILALARAIVRRSKLLILDEATSAIDYETDTVIQTSLRKELDKDVTLLTIAHRLQTIMDADKIMVLDAGKIVEFGKPSELLQKDDGILRGLVDESGDRATLYAMAAEAQSSDSSR
ncbi:unnamed protein product [Somion occarium]|uniref:P-loop containing nucleoside triphosphate hydrolase protein n=1 Tax=Somion occarium TaxID=3059160 RepID=A0ABP1CNC1_9APHY